MRNGAAGLLTSAPLLPVFALPQAAIADDSPGERGVHRVARPAISPTLVSPGLAEFATVSACELAQRVGPSLLRAPSRLHAHQQGELRDSRVPVNKGVTFIRHLAFVFVK